MDTSEYNPNPEVKKSQNYRAARRMVRRKRRFYKFFGTVLCISGFLMFLNLFTSSSVLWAPIPIAGMMLAVGINYVSVFGLPFVGKMDHEWEEEKINEELKKMKRRKDEKTSDDEWYESYKRAKKRKEESMLDLDDDIDLDKMDTKTIERDYKDLFG